MAKGGALPRERVAGDPGSSSGMDSDRFSGPVPMGKVSTRAMPGLPGSDGKVSLANAKLPAAAAVPVVSPRAPGTAKSAPAEAGGTGGANPPGPVANVGLGAMGGANPPVPGAGGVNPPAAGLGGVWFSAALVRSGSGVWFPKPPAGGGGIRPPGPLEPGDGSIGLVKSGIPVVPPGVGGAGGAKPPAAGAGGTSVSANLAGSGGGAVVGVGGGEALPVGGGGSSPSASLAGSGGVTAAGTDDPPGGGGGASVSALFLSSSGGRPPGIGVGGGGARAVASPAGAGGGGVEPATGLSGFSCGLSPAVPGTGGGGGRVEEASLLPAGLGGGGIRSAGLGTGGGGAFLSVPLAEASTTSPLGSVAPGLAEGTPLAASLPSPGLASPPSAVATCSVGGLWPSSSSGET